MPEPISLALALLTGGLASDLIASHTACGKVQARVSIDIADLALRPRSPTKQYNQLGNVRSHATQKDLISSDDTQPPAIKSDFEHHDSADAPLLHDACDDGDGTTYSDEDPSIAADTSCDAPEFQSFQLDVEQGPLEGGIPVSGSVMSTTISRCCTHVRETIHGLGVSGLKELKKKPIATVTSLSTFAGFVYMLKRQQPG